jgi:hypothetical protein
MKKYNILIKHILIGISFISMTLISQPTLAVGADVLILNTTDIGSEAAAAAADGLTVDVVSPTQWGTMTTADFAAYKAIVLGDPNCLTGTDSIAAAEANKAVWGAAITGNVILIGTDEVLHGKNLVSEKGIAFAASKPGKTGAFISLSCYYHGATPLTPVPLLDAFGGPGSFTMTGVGCFNAAHIVATHPALTGLDDTYLSDWNCSVHEAFDTWPLGFEVLAIAQGAGTTFTATDGTIGIPYILARGVAVISDIKLDPTTATNPLGATHILNASVAENGTPSVGVTVSFNVIAGPNVGLNSTGVTDSLGHATWSYSSSVAGIDTIEATFVDSLGRTQRSGRVTKEWIGVPPIACKAGTDFSVNEVTSFSLSGSASSGGVAPLSYSWSQTLPLTGANSATPAGTTPIVSSNTDYNFALTITDSTGQTATCGVVLTVINSDTGPDCVNASASPAMLWPPNHKLKVVRVTGVVDTKSGATIMITSARQDEPTSGLGDGDTGPDAALGGPTARVRAERDEERAVSAPSGLMDEEDGNGRVVHLGFIATNALGQSCTGDVTVGIPHDKKHAPVDDGPLYDATQMSKPRCDSSDHSKEHCELEGHGDE